MFRIALCISQIGIQRHDNLACVLVFMSRSANLSHCVIPIWIHAHGFSNINCKITFYIIITIAYYWSQTNRLVYSFVISNAVMSWSHSLETKMRLVAGLCQGVYRILGVLDCFHQIRLGLDEIRFCGELDLSWNKKIDWNQWWNTFASLHISLHFEISISCNFFERLINITTHII